MVFLPKLAERIQTPAIALPDQAENRREIIGENDETKPATVDRSRDLEDFLILLHESVGRDSAWVLPRSTLVDLQELLGDILHAWLIVNQTRNEGKGREHTL